jgi:MSHA type pilus biogenesis protein MshL
MSQGRRKEMRPTVAAPGTVATETKHAAPQSPQSGLLAPLTLVLVLSAAGCANIKPYVPPSEGHIAAPAAKPEAESAIPPPARDSEFVPPPRPAVKQQTYSVVVNEVPVKDLLFALARDTKQNIDIHPGLAGLVSLNAINETLPAILERLSKQVNMRYRQEGNAIIVSPDTPYVKTYRVNYVNMTRDATSTIGVTGELAVSGASASTSASSSSNTKVTSTSKMDFWEQLEKNIRAILNSTRLQSLAGEARADAQARAKQEQDLRIKQLEAISRTGTPAAGATSIPSNLVASVVSAPASLQPDDVVVNAITGTVTINATERQHQLVQQHIDSMVNAMQRQVLIEATIVEVSLSDAYQGGIDWSRLAISGGLNITQSLLSGFGSGLTQAGNNSFQVGYINPTSRAGNISAAVRLLQEFGNTRVLSSPKLMALNNQTALLKVVDNIVYFEVTSSASQATTGGVLQTITTTPKTVAVGIVMSITPQINEDGRVLLTVRPTVTRLRPEQPFVQDPNPVLVIPNLVPQVQVREMESVLQVGSAQTVVLGGLMQDNVQRAREQIPGADQAGSLGELFRFRNERAAKTELVIFLRPTVVANPSLESEELRFFQRFLPKPEVPPQQPEKTGAAR